MSRYGLTYKLIMCYPNFTTLKFVVIFIFMKKISYFFILLRICFSWQEKQFPTITPPQ